MFSLQMTCPHCRQKETFTLRQPAEYLANQAAPQGRSRAEVVTIIPHHQVSSCSINQAATVQAYGVASCPKCRGPVMIWFECAYGDLAKIIQSSGNNEWILTGAEPRNIRTYPELKLPDDSENFPQKLRAVFVELQEDLEMKRTPARIVAGCRSVMEVALAACGLDKTKEPTLSKRIDKAREMGLITESMKNWAHRVRLDGNEAVHELDASAEDAQQLVNFIRLFLEVVFNLPARIPGATVPGAQ